MHSRWGLLSGLVLGLLVFHSSGLIAQETGGHPGYGTTRPSFDGIGKTYQGREISKVMGHLGAAWLERDSRVSEERPDLLIQSLKLRQGDKVADIGAGTGYFTRRLAAPIGSEGRVYAVDIQQEMLDLLKINLEEAGITNVIPVLGEVDHPKLPAGTLDLILMVDVYHEFSHPFEMTRHMVDALKPGGRLVFVEYRKEDPSVPIKPLHKMSEAQVKLEAQVFPLRFVENISVLPRQHILIFQKESQP